MRKTRLADLIGKLFPGIQGATPVISPMLGALADQTGLITAIQSINPWPATAYNAATNTSSFTATQQQIMAAETTVLALTGAAGGAVALTLPTVAVLLATLTPQQAVVGSTIWLRIQNTTGQTVTVTTAAGWTLNGTMTLATATFRDFLVQITAVGASPAATVQNIGGAAMV